MQTHPATFSADLVQFIATEIAPGGELDADTDLVMTGLVDSLGVVSIVDWIERRLDIRIDPADVVIEHFESVAAMTSYLTARGDTALGDG